MLTTASDPATARPPSRPAARNPATILRSVQALELAISHAVHARNQLLEDLNSEAGSSATQEAILRVLRQKGTMRIGRLHGFLEHLEGLRVTRREVREALEALRVAGSILVDARVCWIRLAEPVSRAAP